VASAGKEVHATTSLIVAEVAKNRNVRMLEATRGDRIMYARVLSNPTGTSKGMNRERLRVSRAE
jgi:hypothetical protein